MSSMGKIKKGDIYDGQEFYDHPYTQTENFQVYIPKQKDNILNLIEKEKRHPKDPYQKIPQRKPSNSQQQFQQQQYQQEQQQQLNESQQSNLQKKLQSQIQQGRSGQYDQEQQRYNQEQNPTLQLTKSSQNFRPGNSGVYSRTQKSATSHGKRKWVPKSTGYTQQQETMKRTQSKLRSKLYFDEKTMSVPKTTLKNRIIENIVQEPNVFLGNKNLLDSVYKLKQLNLLKNHDIHVQKLPGIGKFDFVYNDFHSKSTNNGFSRNAFGGFYTR